MTWLHSNISETSQEKPWVLASILWSPLFAWLGFWEQTRQLLESDTALLKSLESTLKIHLRKLKIDDMLSHIFTEATNFEKQHNTHTQQNLDQAKKVLTEIFIGAMHIYIEQAKKTEPKEKIADSFIEIVKKSRVLRHILWADFESDQEKKAFFWHALPTIVDTNDFWKPLFSERFFTLTTTTLNQDVIGFIFLWMLKFQEFLPETIVQKVHEFHKKYGASSPNGVMQLSLWQDAILLLETIKWKDAQKYAQKVSMCFFIFEKVFAYFLQLKKTAHSNGSPEVVFKQPQAEAILSLMAFAVETLESIQSQDLWLFLNQSFNPYVFYEEPKSSDMVLFYKSPLSTELFAAKIPTQKKRIIATTLIQWRAFFLETEISHEAREMFEMMLGKEIDETMLLRWITYFKQHKGNPLSEIISEYIFYIRTQNAEQVLFQNKETLRKAKEKLKFLPSKHPWYKEALKSLESLWMYITPEILSAKIEEIFSQEHWENESIESIIEQNQKLVFQRFFPDIWVLLNEIFFLFSEVWKKYRIKLLWEIFSHKNSDEDILFLIGILKKVIHDNQDFNIRKLTGKVSIFIDVCRNQHLNEKTTYDNDTLEIIFIYLRESDVAQKTQAIIWDAKQETLWYDQRDILEIFWTQIANPLVEKVEQSWTTEHYWLLARIGKILNGYNQEFASWYIQEEWVTISALENIASFFHFLFSLSEKKIKQFNDIGKIFRFLSPIESTECRRRIHVLYEYFITSGKISETEFEGFKNTILRYMKNGDRTIIDNFLTPELPPEASDIEAGLQGISGKVIAISFQEVARKLWVLEFIEKEKRASGGHRHFHKWSKKISIPHHPGDVWLLVIRETIKGLWITPRYWNSL